MLVSIPVQEGKNKSLPWAGLGEYSYHLANETESTMNGQQPARTSQFGVSFSSASDPTVAALSAAVKAFLAYLRETFTRDSHPADDVAGMNTYMLRDIGAETSIRSHPAGRPDLQYPRL